MSGTKVEEPEKAPPAEEPKKVSSTEAKMAEFLLEQTGPAEPAAQPPPPKVAPAPSEPVMPEPTADVTVAPEDKPPGEPKRASFPAEKPEPEPKKASLAEEPKRAVTKKVSMAADKAGGEVKRGSAADGKKDGEAGKSSVATPKPEEKKTEEGGPSGSVPQTKSQKLGLGSKASRAIAEMKAKRAMDRTPGKKDGKGKVLTIAQQMDAKMTQRDDHVFKAKMAQTIERWDEMVFWIKKVAVLKARMTVDERNLISCAYGNACKTRREAWRKITALEIKERTKAETKARNKRILRIMYFRHMLEKQIRRLSWEILQILDKHLITHAKTAEAKVYFFKMQGDFYRYLAEISFRPKKRRKLTMLSMGSYKAATKIGTAELPVTHPIRLATGLNYAVLWYDLMENGERACRITKNTFDLSIMELDIMKGVNEELIECAVDIMHTLRDNITEWSHAFDPDWKGRHHAQARFGASAPNRDKQMQMASEAASRQKSFSDTTSKAARRAKRRSSK